MFAQEVFIQQFLLHGLHLDAIGVFCVPGHHSQFFQHYGVVNGFKAVLAPGEGAVRFDQYGRNILGLFVLESFNDDFSGFQFIFAANFLGRHG